MTRKVPGGVTWIWCFGLFIFTGICCFFPFCVDSCQDTELVCMNCQCVKARQEANCC
ncbi:MAG: LITAF-like zinc ribbon domain-containing protein [Flammeovirgaceae bacterium]